MKKIKIYSIILAAVVCSCKQQEEKPTKILFVITDGIPADVVEKLETPTLDSLSAKGGYTRAYVGGRKGCYSETPTWSAVGYNSLLTGTWANKHNVWDNSIENPNYNYETVFRFVKEYDSTIKTAIYSTWTDNRTKLIGTEYLDTFFDGYEQDTVQFPHDKNRKFINNIDNHVVVKATEHIKTEGPDISWLYLEYTDDMGHQFGDSPQFYNAVKEMDNQIGQVCEALKHRQDKYNEHWEIWVTTDHGRDSITGKDHGGQTYRERSTWIVTNAKNTNTYFKQSEVAIVDLVPTFLHTLKVIPEKDKVFELDGVPLNTKISVSNPNTFIQNDTLYVKWEATNNNETVKIWVSQSNQFSEGNKDEYTLLKELKSKPSKIKIPIQDTTKVPFKIVIEGKHNSINNWINKK